MAAEYAMRLEVDDGSAGAASETRHVTDYTVVVGYGDAEDEGFDVSNQGRLVLPFTVGAAIDRRATASGDLGGTPTESDLLPLGNGMYADDPHFVLDGVEGAVRDLLSRQYGRKAHTFIGIDPINRVMNELRHTDGQLAGHLYRASALAFRAAWRAVNR